MIVKRENKPQQMIEIDLQGPEGNAYVLMGYANRFGKDLGYSKEKRDKIREEMTSSDYENLLNVFDREFGRYVILYR